ncbi:SH3KBP1-binding 1 [Paramuricea clavata]|uniref:SH3KBP1-binding 1 n=1 Tax=Paramuricea clavata TaxID=317549 RepID=A0A6S7JJL0_PARCT|nr:SH3KBP1-binding 1 [Paramuricea clavata]
MSGEYLLAKSDDMEKRFRNEFNDIIEGERPKMKAEPDAYNAEKQRMKAVEVSDNDIIELNVGGHKLTTKRSTLCQVEGSLLASMFSGRWEDSLQRDKDGAIFFDFNPQYFVVILDYLRAKKIATPENPATLPKVPEDQAKNFNNLLEYLGLSDEIMPAEKVPSEKFNRHSSRGVTLQEGGTVAVHGPNVGHSYVLGENVHQQGIVRFKLKLESFKNNDWMLVGIAKADVVPPNNYSYQWPGSHGWALGQHGQVWKDGSHTIDNALQNVTKQSDTVELVLDCDAAKLSLHLPTGQQFHIQIPKSQTWRLNVFLTGANDKVRIIDDNV